MVTIRHRELDGGRSAVVEIEGAMDGSAGTQLDEYIDTLIKSGVRRALIDGTKIEYVTSAGIGVILLLNKKLSERDGSFALFSLKEEIVTLYRLLGFNREIIIADDLKGALKMIESHTERGMSGSTVEQRIGEKAGLSLSRDTSKSFNSSGSFAPTTTASFEQPVIVECKGCSSLMRVRKSGDFECPECHREFTVKSDMSVVF